MRVVMDTKSFEKQMNNVVKYSLGFLDGAKKGKSLFLTSFGKETVEILKNYIDSNARVNPLMLHHIYEWGKTGSPEARLFEIEYTVSNLGLSFKSTFRQSSTIKSGSRVPFYDKARIMENGIPVTIQPKSSDVLVFEQDGEQIFTKKPVLVENPGGNVKGKFESTFDSFFLHYFTQAFLKSSGLKRYLEKPTAYKKNIKAGSRVGKSKGVDTGYRWIVNAGAVI